MRIGFDAKRAFHNFRGLGNFSRTLINGLTEYYPDSHYLLYTPPIKDDRGQSFANSMAGKATLREPNTKLGQMMPSLWRSMLLADDLKKDGLDIYHGLSHELPPGIDKLSCKSVVTMHDVIFMRHPEFFPWLDRQVYKKKFSYAVSAADRVIAICEQTKRDLIEFLNVPASKIDVVYQSCNPSYFELASGDKVQDLKKRYDLDKDFIFYVGAIEERKNALSLVKAFHKISKDIHHDLIIVGNGKEYKDKIEDYIIENDLIGRVRVLSGISFEDVRLFHQAASLFVFPSFFEGFGIPIIEAMFSQTPVITSEGSCFPESAGPNSVFINPNDVEQLAFEIRRVLQDLDLQNNMIVNGLEYVQKFHLKNTSADLFSLYSRIKQS